MKLQELMGAGLSDVCLCQREEHRSYDVITGLDPDTLTGQGKQAWADVLEAEVCHICPGGYGINVELTGVSGERLKAFTRMLAGDCTVEDYERWVRDEDRNYAQEGEEAEAEPWTYKIAILASVYEELTGVPREERLVCYFEAYGGYYFRAGTAPGEVRQVYKKALGVLGVDEAGYREAGGFTLSRGGIIGWMRDCLLAEELKPEEEVLFVNTEPYAGEDDFSPRGGIVKRIDRKERTCDIRGAFFDMEDVPLHYVLGRYHPDIAEKHYGWEDVEVLFKENRALAQAYRKEAYEAWKAMYQEEQEPVPGM